VATAAARMLYTKRDQLVVVDERGVAVGCISMNDVLRWLVFPAPAPAPAKT
jgi:CBS domain containing-hemolysin-like protein